MIMLKISLILITCITIFNNSSFSQPFIGVGGQYSLNVNNTSTIEKLGGFSLRAGYMFNNKLNTSLEYSYNKKIPTVVNHVFSDIGLTAEYLFFDYKIKPFAGVKIAYSTNQVKEEIANLEFPKEKGVFVSPKVGVNIQSKKHLFINIGGSYNHYFIENPISFFSINIGIDYHI